MNTFDPFLTVKIDYVQEVLMEVVIGCEYDDMGQAECSIETVLCLFANLIKSYDGGYSFELTGDEEYYEGLQDELHMYWMNHTFMMNTITTMLKLDYIKEEDGYFSLNENCPLTNTRYNLYNRLDKHI